jgi:hypothetical protein
MANILTAAEAARVVRTEITDQIMLDLLPSVDAFIQEATGRDWAKDTTVRAVAKSAARMLLVMWYENPGMVGNGITTLGSGLTAALLQLEALAMQYMEFQGRDGAGAIILTCAQVGDTVSSLVGISGATGDQTNKFESMITAEDEIQQISSDDLTEKYYRAYLIPLGSL